MIHLGQSSVVRRQSQRLGWRIHGSRIKRQRKIVFDWCSSWGYIRESCGRVVVAQFSMAIWTWAARESTALRRRLWVSCSKTQWHKKPWTSTHFCRGPLGIIVFDVVKGTSATTGTFSSVPWDVDLALCPRSFTEARPNSQHTHHTHTRTACARPPFQPQHWMQIPEKLWQQKIGELFPGLLLTCKIHSPTPALCQKYPKISSRIQNCKRQYPWIWKFYESRRSCWPSGHQCSISNGYKSLGVDFWGRRNMGFDVGTSEMCGLLCLESAPCFPTFLTSLSA